MGVVVAIQADDVQAAQQAGTLADEIKGLAEQAQEGLRRFVGGAQPRSDLAINLDGPQEDPIQGTIYGLTLAAKFDTDDLPGDCEAYRIYVTERGERGA